MSDCCDRWSPIPGVAALVWALHNLGQEWSLSNPCIRAIRRGSRARIPPRCRVQSVVGSERATIRACLSYVYLSDLSSVMSNVGCQSWCTRLLTAMRCSGRALYCCTAPGVITRRRPLIWNMSPQAPTETAKRRDTHRHGARSPRAVLRAGKSGEFGDEVYPTVTIA